MVERAWQHQGTMAEGEERELTDERIANARQRIGIEVPHTRPFNEFATKDSIRHYAEGIGDINPLWVDEEYAEKTRWKGIIAPPSFYSSMGVSEKKTVTPEERELGRNGLQGLHGWYAGDRLEWFRPVYPGDRLTVKSFLEDLVEKRSQFSGRSVIGYNKNIYWNQRGELVLIHRSHGVTGGRQRQWGERQKYADIEPATYTPEEIARIDADYEGEEVRGSTPRYWEDVEVGEELPAVVKGPLTLTDIFNFNAGLGVEMYKGAHRHAYEWRKRHPLGYSLNSHGIPDLIERVHWEDEASWKTGNPIAYDYGQQRKAWLCNVTSNWVGDDGWLWKQYNEFRRFVYVGDTSWVRGKVTGKYIQGEKCVVELDIWCEDQRGRNTAPGNATVLLPSREHGPVQTPVRPEEDSLTP